MTRRPSEAHPSYPPSGARGDAQALLARLPGNALTPPLGMRDLLPPESRARRRVSEQLQAVFEGYGYELITTPLFEHVEVFERGLTLDPRDLMRFVEPDSGEVAALRPDMTPQIARVVSTRLADYPAPWRMRYEGTVVRRRRGRARKQRQIAQVGIELIGLPGGAADLEVVRLIADAVRSTGLSNFRIELAEVGVGRALLQQAAGAATQDLLELASEPMARKDEAQLKEALSRAGVSDDVQARFLELVQLHGDLSVLREAQKLVKGLPAAAAHLSTLSDVAERLVDLGFGSALGVDLGEIRGAAYYTGVSFSLYAPGPGEVLASGGRYDALLGRYGMPQPATGAAIDLENLLWALDHAGQPWRERSSLRVVVSGEDAVKNLRVADGLRAQGVPAATLGAVGLERALDYALAWGYDVAVEVGASEATARRAHDGAEHKLPSDPGMSDIAALLAWARSLSKE